MAVANTEVGCFNYVCPVLRKSQIPVYSRELVVLTSAPYSISKWIAMASGWEIPSPDLCLSSSDSVSSCPGVGKRKKKNSERCEQTDCRRTEIPLEDDSQT